VMTLVFGEYRLASHEFLRDGAERAQGNVKPPPSDSP
jgi:hypothetical protein